MGKMQTVPLQPFDKTIMHGNVAFVAVLHEPLIAVPFDGRLSKMRVNVNFSER